MAAATSQLSAAQVHHVCGRVLTRDGFGRDSARDAQAHRSIITHDRAGMRRLAIRNQKHNPQPTPQPNPLTTTANHNHNHNHITLDPPARSELTRDPLWALETGQNTHTHTINAIRTRRRGVIEPTLVSASETVRAASKKHADPVPTTVLPTLNSRHSACPPSLRLAQRATYTRSFTFDACLWSFEQQARSSLPRASDRRRARGSLRSGRAMLLRAPRVPPDPVRSPRSARSSPAHSSARSLLRARSIARRARRNDARARRCTARGRDTGGGPRLERRRRRRRSGRRRAVLLARRAVRESVRCVGGVGARAVPSRVAAVASLWTPLAPPLSSAREPSAERARLVTRRAHTARRRAPVAARRQHAPHPRETPPAPHCAATHAGGALVRSAPTRPSPPPPGNNETALYTSVYCA